MMRKILFIVLSAVVALPAIAQNATNSPYSQFGYGQLADQANGAAVGMSGLAQGWREGNTVNFSNAASYSSVDSLSFIFDAGISGIVTSFTEGQRRLNAYNTSFDYIVGAFRLFPRVGFAFGFMPYSNVGYSYSSDEEVGSSVTSGDTKTTATQSYSGSGGIHQVFIGVGFSVVKSKRTDISLGANVSYLWGNYNRAAITEFSDAYVRTLSKYYRSNMYSYKVDVALQWQQRVSRYDKFTIGATYSFGHKMNSHPRCTIISADLQSGVADTTQLRAANGYDDAQPNAKLSIPTSIVAGIMWNHANRLRIGFDWHYDLWKNIDYPMYEIDNEKEYYIMKSGYFKNRMKFIVGAEYCYNEMSRQWAHRLRYRLGASYTTPYLRLEETNVDGIVIGMRDGPREYGVSAGVGIPIMNAYNNRSVLNISASWTRTEARGLIKENSFRINIGLTFNERWFAKWQVE